MGPEQIRMNEAGYEKKIENPNTGELRVTTEQQHNNESSECDVAKSKDGPAAREERSNLGVAWCLECLGQAYLVLRV
jgi:hypothetical protein